MSLAINPRLQVTLSAAAATVLLAAGCTTPENWTGDFVGTDGQGRSAHGDFHINGNDVSGRVDGYSKKASVPGSLHAIQGDDGSTVFTIGKDTVIVQIVDDATAIVRRNGEPLVLDFPNGYVEPASAAMRPGVKPAVVDDGVLLLGAGLAVLGCWSWASIYCTASGQGTFDYNNGAVYDAFGQYGGGYCAYPCTSPTSSEHCGDGTCNGAETCQSCSIDCGSCSSGCTTHNYKACSNGDVHWFNSCSDLEDLAQACNGCGCAGTMCSSCNSVSPSVSVSPQTVAKAKDCMTQSLSGFSPNGTATCHPKNQWGDTTFNLSLNSSGANDNTYCPGAGAGVGEYEFWCVDNATGLASNHVNFWITQ